MSILRKHLIFGSHLLFALSFALPVNYSVIHSRLEVGAEYALKGLFGLVMFPLSLLMPFNANSILELVVSICFVLLPIGNVVYVIFAITAGKMKASRQSKSGYVLAFFAVLIALFAITANFTSTPIFGSARQSQSLGYLTFIGYYSWLLAFVGFATAQLTKQ